METNDRLVEDLMKDTGETAKMLIALGEATRRLEDARRRDDKRMTWDQARMLADALQNLAFLLAREVKHDW